MSKKGHWVWNSEKRKFVPYEGKQASRSHFIHTDEISPTVHPADGRVYTSKSNFRKTTQANGCIEMGNEAPTMQPQRDDDSDLNESLSHLYDKFGGRPD